MNTSHKKSVTGPAEPAGDAAAAAGAELTAALTNVIAEMQEAVFQADAERAFLKIERWADRLEAALPRPAQGQPDWLVRQALESAKEWLDELGCDCGTDEPGTCAWCLVTAALSAPAPPPAEGEAYPETRDDDIPLTVKRNLMAAAVGNGSINYYWLCDVYRRGFAAGAHSVTP